MSAEYFFLIFALLMISANNDLAAGIVPAEVLLAADDVQVAAPPIDEEEIMGDVDVSETESMVVELEAEAYSDSEVEIRDHFDRLRAEGIIFETRQTSGWPGIKTVYDPQ